MLSVMVVCPEVPSCPVISPVTLSGGCWMQSAPLSCGQTAPRYLQHLPVFAMPAQIAPMTPMTPSPTISPVRSVQASVVGRVWRLSRNAEGCRLVQDAIETAASDEERSKITAELEGHVWEALRCPHANHVLQKCIAASGPKASQFIINEILLRGKAGAQDAARHPYGCRVIQRLLEHCRPEQVGNLVEAFLSSAMALSRHEFGNFVMQQVVEHGSPGHKHRLAVVLAQHARAAGSDMIACAVLTKALQHCSEKDAIALAQELVREKRLIARMARSRNGHGAARAMLHWLQGEDKVEAKEQLLAEAASLRTSRYGKSVLSCVSSASSHNPGRRGRA